MRSILHRLATSVVVAAMATIAAANAQPTGGTVAYGGATIATPSATSTVITQSTNATIINWQSFSVGSGSSVVFDQPSAAAIALNRVLGGGVSQINGNLQANGQIWIINANGILFGKGSQINVAGLLATTSDIADGDFASGRYDLTTPSTNPSASVDNAGTIHVANGGSAVLSAPHVSNSGLIQADAGQIVLGGASAFTVDFDGDNLLRYAITTPVESTPTDANGIARKELVANSGTLSSAGGKILLTARAAANVADNVVNNSGMISATSASVHNGEVVLDAGDGMVEAGGTIAATGNGAGQTGGNITLAGNAVNVADNAVIDASGDKGGGTIAIGGGLHGSGSYPSAQNTTVAASAAIHADAHTNGNGGTVSVWSVGTTKFAGTVTALGGSQSGNGGMVETSGHILSVADTAMVSTGAAHGALGDWLLDPLTLTIVASSPNPDPILTGGTLPYSNSASTITAATIEAALGGSPGATGTNVTLQAVDDIFVNAAVTAIGTGHTLTLDAGGSIVVNANINVSGNGSGVVLSADNAGAPGTGVGGTGTVAGISGSGIITGDTVGLILGTNPVNTLGTIGSAASPINIGGGVVSIQSNGADAFVQNAGSATSMVLGNSNLGSGHLTAVSSGDLTIAAGSVIASSASGDAVVLAATNNFINDAGSGAISLTGSGRFLIYSAAPEGDTFGALNSGHTAIWNTIYPTGVASGGNRYVFALQPTLTLTTTDQVKTYGTDDSAALASAYTVTGFDPGIAGVYLADTAATALTGSPSITSAGSAASASVAGGPYTITVSQGSLTSPAGYALSFVSTGKLTVDTALLSVTADPLSKVYGTSDPTLTYSVSGLVNGDTSAVFSGALSRAAGENVGNYAINQGTLSAGGNYTIEFTGANFSITKALLSVVADPQSKVYGTSDPTLTYSFSGLANGDTSAVFVGALGRAPGENVGNYAINLGTLSAGGNYTISFTGANFSITKALLSVTANPQTKVYGTADPTLTYGFSGLVNGDTSAVFVGALGRAAGQNVGNYAITIGTLSAGGNYTIAFTSANFSITPALLSVTANPQTKVYGANDPKLTYGFSGLVNGDTSAVFVGALTRAPGQNVGDYAITQGTLSAGANYTITFTGANFAITPATLTYVATSVNRTYGSANPALGGTVTGLVNGDTLASATSGTLSFTTSATASSNVGSYAIDGSGLTANNGNYVFVQSANNATALKINPATLTYVATAGTIDQGSPIPLLTGMVTGFVNGDTLASATTGTLEFTTAATASSPPGVYAIDGSGLSANHGNYVFVQDPGNATALTINTVVVQNEPGLQGFYPWPSNGDPDNSPLGQFTEGNNSSDPYTVVADNGGNDLPAPDLTTLSGPIAELTATAGYLESPTNTDRRSSALSRYFNHGSLFDANFPSWGNDLFWH